MTPPNHLDKKIRRLWHQHWIMGFIILSAILVILSSVNLARDIGRPFGGFLTFYNPLRYVSVVTEDTPVWWPGLQSGQIALKDGIATIEGQPYNTANAKTVFKNFYEQEKPGASITKDTNLQHPVLTPIVLFTWANFIDLQLPGLLLGLGYWLTALTIYRANPTNSLHRITAILGVILVLFGLGRSSLYWQDGTAAKFLDLVGMIRSSFLGSMIIHFSLLFPMRSKFLKQGVLYLFYGLSFITASFYTASRIVFWNRGTTDLAVRLDGYGFFLLWRLLSAGLILLALRLLWLWSNPDTARRPRREAAIFLLGLLIASPHIIIQIGNALFNADKSLFWKHLDLRYFLLAIPMVLTITLLRYKTFHSTPPQLLFVPMLTSSALLASIGASLLFSARPKLFNAYPLPPFFMIFLLTLTTSVIWGTQSSWRGWFSRLLHWEQQSYAAVRRFGQRVIEQQNTAETPTLITNALRAELNLERTAVWLWRAEQGAFCLVGQDGAWSRPPPQQLPMLLNQTIKSPLPIQLHRQEKELADWLKPLRRLHEVEIVVPLSVSGQPVGLLALGKRWDEASFDERDLKIAELVGQQSALFLLTAVQVKKLRQMPRQIDQAQERERYKIAGELHDTIQQFLGRLPFYLEVSRSLLRDDPQKADLMLQNCIADIADAAQTVRHIRGNLAPTQLENEFVRSVNGLIKRFQFRTKITITFNASPELDALTSLDVRHALYRVIQQSLDNIAKHARTQQATVSLPHAGGKIFFSIIDEGVGSSAAERDRAQLQGSFGLRSMQARINAAGGEFIFNSSPGKGTQVSGWVPTHSGSSLP